MGKYKKGTLVTLELITVNKSTRQKIDVSAVSCYIEKDETAISVLSASHILTGVYRSNWQSDKSLATGKYQYVFAFKYQGRHLKPGVCELG
jgi:hypothetical protein